MCMTIGWKEFINPNITDEVAALGSLRDVLEETAAELLLSSGVGQSDTGPILEAIDAPEIAAEIAQRLASETKRYLDQEADGRVFFSAVVGPFGRLIRRDPLAAQYVAWKLLERESDTPAAFTIMLFSADLIEAARATDRLVELALLLHLMILKDEQFWDQVDAYAATADPSLADRLNAADKALTEVLESSPHDHSAEAMAAWASQTGFPVDQGIESRRRLTRAYHIACLRESVRPAGPETE